MKRIRFCLAAVLIAAAALFALGAQAGTFTTSVDGSVMTASGYGTVTVADAADWAAELLSHPQVTALEIVNQSDTKTVTAIDSHAFDCLNTQPEVLAKLDVISVPDTVVRIGELAFRGCGFSGFHLPSELEELVYGAFAYCKKLTQIAIPRGVQLIPGECFTDCTSLTALTIPDSVTEIRANAFCNCPKLKTVYFLGSHEKWLYLITHGLVPTGNDCLTSSALNVVCVANACGDSARWSMYGTRLVITGEGAIWSYYNDDPPTDWSAATEIAIDEGITSIGYSPFSGLKKLKKVSLPSTLMGIGSYAFYGCSALTTVNLPDQVGYIGSCAFGDCDSLTAVRLPVGLQFLGSGAFNGCAALTDVTVASGNPYIRVRDGMLLQSGGSDLSGVLQTAPSVLHIPDTVTSIDNLAFVGCTGLSEAYFPDSWKPETGFGNQLELWDIYFPANAWAWCSQNSTADDYFTITGHARVRYLTECDLLDLPGDTEAIEEEAFEGTHFERVVIPYGVTEIPSRAFADMGFLTKIVLPSSIRYIADDAFDGVHPLTVVIRDYLDYECGAVLDRLGIFTLVVFDPSVSE